MTGKLKKIIKEHGTQILYTPQALEDQLRQAGIGEKDAGGLVLLLNCCPVIAELIEQGQIGQPEAQSLLQLAVRRTGLSVSTARHLLGLLLSACGIYTGWARMPQWAKNRNDETFVPEDLLDKKAEALIEALESKKDSAESELLGELESLARGGCGRAAYALGMFYKKYGREDDDGVAYFQLAREAGFGPANGALAQHEIEQAHMWAAERYFRSPMTIFGAEGRKWLPLSRKFFAYRQENEARLKETLIIQALVLALSIAMCALLDVGGFWRFACIGMQIAGLGWSGYCRLFSPCHSVSTAVYLMSISWVVLALAGI